jgi:hypothetical protein
VNKQWDSVDQGPLVDQEKCTRQLVQTAARNAKFPSSQPKAGQYIAGIACRNTGNPGSNLKIYNLLIFSLLL